MAVIFFTTLLASFLLVPFFCSLTRSNLTQTHLNSTAGDRLSPVRKQKTRPTQLELEHSHFMSSIDKAAAMPPPPPPQPCHRFSSSVAQSPRSDTFKRMPTEIDTSDSATSTRPNSVVTTFTEDPVEVSSPASRRSLSFEPTNSFLTAVASQERYVLELREALQKAESDLHRLKTYWTQQEAVRKRQEVYTNTEAMRPLTSPMRSAPVAERPSHRQSLSLEDERKRTMLAKPRVPERKVLTGRHTRTLSLLSPNALANWTPSQPGSDEQDVPILSSAPTPTGEYDFGGRPHANSRGTRDDLVNTGKQLVGDLREGLWSFWDDLRQATVGDEAIKEPPVRGQGRLGATADPALDNSHRQSARRRDSHTLLNSPRAGPATVAAVPSVPSQTTDLDGNSLGISTERNEANAIGKDDRNDDIRKQGKVGLNSEGVGLQPATPGRETIPWPALQKLSSMSLQRTASNLMKEWERSLSPPAEESRKDWIDRYIDDPRKQNRVNSVAERKTE